MDFSGNLWVSLVKHASLKTEKTPLTFTGGYPNDIQWICHWAPLSFIGNANEFHWKLTSENQWQGSS
jgi:hypothetical protein